MFFAKFQPVSKKKVVGKKVAAAPNIGAKTATTKKVSLNPLFEKRSKNYGIGESLISTRLFSLTNVENQF